ncbi:hypothetical protein C8F04DRAFT_1196959 [Mycena alexandri]|uniref:Uncharacterized protein n=1 Tax=Mycena alexandri TaxID=1745969 RepID=A0AAD6S442_9AGAR|nr:hypothetical protein C8F04DRAFT_1196959 [Mycena alexandri]
MPHQFTSTPSKYVVRPLYPAPRPITLPIILTNILYCPCSSPPLACCWTSIPVPRLLPSLISTHLLRLRTLQRRGLPLHALQRLRLRALRRLRLPAPAPAPALTPRSRRRTPDSRVSLLTSTESSDSDSDSESSSNETSRRIARPSGANIQTVKDLFKALYRDSSEGDQGKKYTDFRSRLDLLCTQHLCPGVALSFQDEEKREKVYTKMTTEYPWLAQYQGCWPVASPSRCGARSKIDSCGGGRPINQASTKRRRRPPGVNRWVTVYRHRAADRELHLTGSQIAGRARVTFPLKEKTKILLHTVPTMVNTRKQVAVHRCTVKSLRSRHFSTTHQTARFAFTPTQIELRNPDPALKPKRRPLVEAHFSDKARQPFIHDFRVKVKHGRKVSNFCVFLKRGKTLDLNRMATASSATSCSCASAKRTRTCWSTCARQIRRSPTLFLRIAYLPFPGAIAHSPPKGAGR